MFEEGTRVKEMKGMILTLAVTSLASIAVNLIEDLGQTSVNNALDTVARNLPRIVCEQLCSIFLLYTLNCAIKTPKTPRSYCDKRAKNNQKLELFLSERCPTISFCVGSALLETTHTPFKLLEHA